MNRSDDDGASLLMAHTLDIPDAVVEALELPGNEADQRLRLELAIALCREGLVPVARARLLTGLDRFAFRDELARRGVDLDYTEADLADDVAYADRSEVLAPQRSPAERLVASLDVHPVVEEAWAEEVERRHQELESREAEEVAGPETVARIRAELL